MLITRAHTHTHTRHWNNLTIQMLMASYRHQLPSTYPRAHVKVSQWWSQYPCSNGLKTVIQALPTWHVRLCATMSFTCLFAARKFHLTGVCKLFLSILDLSCRHKSHSGWGVARCSAWKGCVTSCLHSLRSSSENVTIRQTKCFAKSCHCKFVLTGQRTISHQFFIVRVSRDLSQSTVGNVDAEYWGKFSLHQLCYHEHL